MQVMVIEIITSREMEVLISILVDNYNNDDDDDDDNDDNNGDDDDNDYGDDDDNDGNDDDNDAGRAYYVHCVQLPYADTMHCS